MLRTVLIFITMIFFIHAEELVVVTNIRSPIVRLTQSQVRMLYLKKRRFWGDTRLLVLNLPPQNILRQTFEEDILQMSAHKLDNYWIKQHYKGHRPPYRVESVESMLLFIKKVKGAIGYLPLTKVEKGMKIIYEDHTL